MDIRTRAAEQADAGALFDLVGAFATSFEPERAAFDRTLGELLGSPAALIDVAVVDRAVVGYCLALEHRAFYANGPVTWVEEIMVADAQRGRGVGRALMAGVERWAEARGSGLIGLATRRAAGFYRAIGYEESALYFRKLTGAARGARSVSP